MIPNISTKCSCEWKITNCCTKNAGAGAVWNCTNEKTFECEKNFVSCPQIPSPKPNLACVCKEGSCVVE